MDAAQKAKFEQRMVLLLLVIFMAARFNTLRRLGVLGGKPRPGAPPTALAKTVQQMQQYEAAIQQVEQGIVPSGPAIDYPMEGVRDPLVSLLSLPVSEPLLPGSAGVAGASAGVEVAPRPPTVTIQGIIVGGRPQAIIDRTLYGVGDTVGGVARIVAIDHSGVTMEVQGSQFLVSPTGTTTPVSRTGGER